MEDDHIDTEDDLEMTVSIWEMTVSIWEMTVLKWDILILGRSVPCPPGDERAGFTLAKKQADVVRRCRLTPSNPC